MANKKKKKKAGDEHRKTVAYDQALDIRDMQVRYETLAASHANTAGQLQNLVADMQRFGRAVGIPHLGIREFDLRMEQYDGSGRVEWRGPQAAPADAAPKKPAKRAPAPEPEAEEGDPDDAEGEPEE